MFMSVCVCMYVRIYIREPHIYMHAHTHTTYTTYMCVCVCVCVCACSPMYKVEMMSIHERPDAPPTQRMLVDGTALGEHVAADGEPLQWPTLPDHLIGEYADVC